MEKQDANQAARMIRSLMRDQKYREVVRLAQNLDPDSIKNGRLILDIVEAYSRLNDNVSARDILYHYYQRRGISGEMMMRKLIALCMETGDTDKAVQLCMDYEKKWPRDSISSLMRYQIASAAGGSLEERIAYLKEYNAERFEERWGYELARLYEKNHQIAECSAICHELICFFGYGPYVERAAELKRRIDGLTEDEKTILEAGKEREAQTKQQKEEARLRAKEKAKQQEELRRHQEKLRQEEERPLQQEEMQRREKEEELRRLEEAYRQKKEALSRQEREDGYLSAGETESDSFYRKAQEAGLDKIRQTEEQARRLREKREASRAMMENRVDNALKNDSYYDRLEESGENRIYLNDIFHSSSEAEPVAAFQEEASGEKKPSPFGKLTSSLKKTLQTGEEDLIEEDDNEEVEYITVGRDSEAYVQDIKERILNELNLLDGDQQEKLTDSQIKELYELKILHDVRDEIRDLLAETNAAGETQVSETELERFIQTDPYRNPLDPEEEPEAAEEASESSREEKEVPGEEENSFVEEQETPEEEENSSVEEQETPEEEDSSMEEQETPEEEENSSVEEQGTPEEEDSSIEEQGTPEEEENSFVEEEETSVEEDSFIEETEGVEEEPDLPVKEETPEPPEKEEAGAEEKTPEPPAKEEVEAEEETLEPPEKEEAGAEEKTPEPEETEAEKPEKEPEPTETEGEKPEKEPEPTETEAEEPEETEGEKSEKEPETTETEAEKPEEAEPAKPEEEPAPTILDRISNPEKVLTLDEFTECIVAFANRKGYQVDPSAYVTIAVLAEEIQQEGRSLSLVTARKLAENAMERIQKRNPFDKLIDRYSKKRAYKLKDRHFYWKTERKEEEKMEEEEPLDIKMIALDMDGTLLLPDKSLSQENKQVLTRAAKQGIQVVLSTGRPATAITETVEQLPFVRYVVLSNGAVVKDLTTDQTIAEYMMSTQEALRLYDYAKEHQVMVDFFTEGDRIVSAEWKKALDNMEITQGTRQMLLANCREVENPRAYLEKLSGVEKMNLRFPNEEARNALYGKVEKEFPGLNICSSLNTNIEANKKGVSKALGLEALSKHLGLEMKSIMAFGDSCNDLEMLQQAGIGVAMGNAEEETKKAADRVTKTNTEDGVAYMIKEVLGW